MGKKGKNKNRRVGKGTNDGNDTTPGYAFTVIDDISDSQSKLLSEQGRHVFYAMFAAAWATLWADGERIDMTGKILLILVLCIGIIYLILHLGRYYTLTKVSREILDHLLTKKYDDDKASIHMNIASDNAFKVMKVEWILLSIMGVLNIIYYIRKLLEVLIVNNQL